MPGDLGLGGAQLSGHSSAPAFATEILIGSHPAGGRGFPLLPVSAPLLRLWSWPPAVEGATQ